MWQGLIDGRWSLVERFDVDGKRYLLAHKNPEQVDDPRGLSELEARVTNLAVRGYSDKLIPYHLGVPQGTVGSCMSRALRKLGVAAPSPEVVHELELELEPFVFDTPSIQESERRLHTRTYFFDGDVAYFRVRGPDGDCYQIGRLRLDTREEELLGALGGRAVLKIGDGEILELAGRNTDNDGHYVASRPLP